MESKMDTVYQEILSKSLTSAQTEDLIRLNNFDIISEPGKVSPTELEALIHEVKHKLSGVDIKVVQTRIKGKIVLELKGNNKQTADFLREVLLTLSAQNSIRGNKVEELMILE